jgi:von Willebrand factor type A domain
VRRWSSDPRIDSSDTGGLRAAALRTRAIRVILLVAALALLALTASAASGHNVGRQRLLTAGASVVVVDLSLSITQKDYNGIRRTLERLIADKSRVGLVIFSDVPYELLPPGTPASELRPVLRLLAPRKHGPLNPWTGTFSAGTQISSALDLAREMLVHYGAKKGSILLVSDLINAPQDVPELARTVHDLQRESIRLRVVPLSPLPDGETIFRGLLGKKGFIPPAKISAGADPVRSASSPFPTGLLVLAGLLLAVLAAHELLAGSLGLPHARRSAT